MFDANTTNCEETLDDLLECDTDSPRRFDRRASVPERQGLSYFGPRQGKLKYIIGQLIVLLAVIVKIIKNY